jgi:hypothetical protein
MRLKDLGVAVVFAAANADIIEPTVSKMTSILDEMMFNNSIIDLDLQI